MRMARDPEWVARYFAYLKTHQLPRDVDAFDPLTLHAFLTHMDDACRLISAQAEADDGGEESWDEPVYTGDPVADEWERSIAEGRDPDI